MFFFRKASLLLALIPAAALLKPAVAAAVAGPESIPPAAPLGGSRASFSGLGLRGNVRDPADRHRSGDR